MAVQLAWNQEEDGTYLAVMILEDDVAIETSGLDGFTPDSMLINMEPYEQYQASRQGRPQPLAIVLDGGVSGVTVNRIPAEAPAAAGDAQRRADEPDTLLARLTLANARLRREQEGR